MNRLEHQYGDVYDALSRRSVSEQRVAAARLVAAALQANRLGPAAAAEVERLDEHAWAVQEEAECGRAAQEDYESAFCAARAASAARFLADSEAAWHEVVYEALHALPADFDWRRLVSG